MLTLRHFLIVHKRAATFEYWSGDRGIFVFTVVFCGILLSDDRAAEPAWCSLFLCNVMWCGKSRGLRLSIQSFRTRANYFLKSFNWSSTLKSLFYIQFLGTTTLCSVVAKAFSLKLRILQRKLPTIWHVITTKVATVLYFWVPQALSTWSQIYWAGLSYTMAEL